MAPSLSAMLFQAFAVGAAAQGNLAPTIQVAPGVWMPMLAFGTANKSLLPNCTVADAVAQWLQLGGRHIDTAHNYGTQPAVGAGIKASGVRRQDIFVTTKVPGPIGKQEVISLITGTALPQLGLDYIDLVLIHYPCVNASEFPDKCGPEEWREQRLATWAGLTELKQAGKIRAVGVSNYNAGHVQETITLGGGRPVVNQVEWHLGYHNETLLAAMKGSGVTLEAWGSLTGPTAGNPGISLSDPRLEAIAKKYNASTAQIALRWSTMKGVVPVTATCSKDHALSDLASFNINLSPADIAALDALTPKPVVDQVVV